MNQDLLLGFLIPLAIVIVGYLYEKSRKVH
jgi:hypothetical protein